MKIYLVGGAVRDMLMGLKPVDKDYVVTGTTPEEMLALGYQQVGANFPVFLHPETREEYALARTEIKNGNGYQGFECHFGPEVTLEDDLARRDLTVNAMAKDIETGEIIDPFNGQEDIKNKILRATTKHFKEDPVRVLRLARFLARFGPEWGVAPETTQFVLDLHDSGELKHLTPERIWKELEKALSERYTQEFFSYLQDMDLFPEYDAGYGVEQPPQWHPEGDVFNHQQECLRVAGRSKPLIKFAVMVHDFGKAVVYKQTGKLYGHEDAGVPVVDSFCDRLKIPNEYRKIGKITAKYHTHIHNIEKLKPKTIYKVIENTKALTNRFIFDNFLMACAFDANGRGKIAFYPQFWLAVKALDAVESVDTKEISTRMLASGKSGVAIGEAIKQARIKAIAEEKKKWVPRN